MGQNDTQVICSREVQLLEQMAGETTNINDYVFSESGRLYLDRGLWRGMYNTYGFAYYQFAQALGNNNAPIYNTNQVKGFIVPRDGKIKSIKLISDRNATEEATVEYSFDIIRGGTNTLNVTKIVDNNYNTSNFLHSINLDFEVLEDDIFVFAGRKVNGTTRRIYSHISMTVKFE